jgi:hypothetical protein
LFANPTTYDASVRVSTLRSCATYVRLSSPLMWSARAAVAAAIKIENHPLAAAAKQT